MPLDIIPDINTTETLLHPKIEQTAMLYVPITSNIGNSLLGSEGCMMLHTVNANLSCP